MNGSPVFPKGQYQFPFSFLLNDHLPGTFNHQFTEQGTDCYGKVEYDFWAGLKNNDTILFDKFNFSIDQKLSKNYK